MADITYNYGSTSTGVSTPCSEAESSSQHLQRWTTQGPKEVLLTRVVKDKKHLALNQPSEVNAEPATGVTCYVNGGRQNIQSPGQHALILERGPITSQIRITFSHQGVVQRIENQSALYPRWTLLESTLPTKEEGQILEMPFCSPRPWTAHTGRCVQPQVPLSDKAESLSSQHFQANSPRQCEETLN